ncbi:hypothetical protein ACA910_000174 [Epithemia clementina (nom. ined.)]
MHFRAIAALVAIAPGCHSGDVFAAAAISSTSANHRRHRRVDKTALLSSFGVHQQEAESSLNHAFGKHHATPLEAEGAYESLEEKPLSNIKVDTPNKTKGSPKSGVRGAIQPDVQHINNAEYFGFATTSSDSGQSTKKSKGVKTIEKAVQSASELDDGTESSSETQTVSYPTFAPVGVTVTQTLSYPTFAPVGVTVLPTSDKVIYYEETTSQEVVASNSSSHNVDGDVGGHNENKIADLPTPGLLQLPQAAFKYSTTARWNLPERDEIELHGVTQEFFSSVFEQEYGDQLDFVDVASYAKLAPRVFQFVVMIHFKKSEAMPSLSEMESTLAELLRPGQAFILKYLALLRSTNSTIFETSLSVKYLYNADELEKAINELDENMADDSEDEGAHTFLFFILLLVVALLVLVLLCSIRCWCYRYHKARTAPVHDDYDSHDLKSFNSKGGSHGSRYRTAAFSPEGIGIATGFPSAETASRRKTTGDEKHSDNFTEVIDFEEVPLFEEDRDQTTSTKNREGSIGQIPTNSKPPRYPFSERFKDSQSTGAKPAFVKPQMVSQSNTAFVKPQMAQSNLRSREDNISKRDNAFARDQTVFDEQSDSSSLSESRASHFETDSRATPTQQLTTIDNGPVKAEQVVSPLSAQIQDYDEMDHEEDFESLPSVKERMAMLKASLSQRSTGESRSGSGASTELSPKLQIPAIVDVQAKPKPMQNEKISLITSNSNNRSETRSYQAKEVSSVSSHTAEYSISSGKAKEQYIRAVSPISVSRSGSPSQRLLPSSESGSPSQHVAPSSRSVSPVKQVISSSVSNSRSGSPTHRIPPRSRSGSPARRVAPVSQEEQASMPEWMRKFHEMGLEKSED